MSKDAEAALSFATNPYTLFRRTECVRSREYTFEVGRLSFRVHDGRVFETVYARFRSLFYYCGSYVVQSGMMGCHQRRDVTARSSFS